MISVQSPTRVDLCGGTLDLWPLYLLVNEAYVVNFSIDIYTEVQLKEKKDLSIELEVSELSFKKTFSHFQALKTEMEKKKFVYPSEENAKREDCSQELSLAFLWPHLCFWNPSSLGFSLKTSSHSPVGGGIGGSSSLCVSLIKAFSQWLKKKMSREQVVQLASNLEAKILGFPTGTQDYFPAFKEGLYVIRYDVNGFDAKTVSDQWMDVFSESMMLIDTGQAHHSGSLNWKVYQSALQKKQDVLESLGHLAGLSQKIAELCFERKWEFLPELLNQEFSFRLHLDKDFVPPRVQQLKEELINLGVEAVKICGAGGGGCVFVWAPKKKVRERVFRFCEKNSFFVLKTKAISSSQV